MLVKFRQGVFEAVSDQPDGTFRFIDRQHGKAFQRLETMSSRAWRRIICGQ
jgi:hypothetical protein